MATGSTAGGSDASGAANVAVHATVVESAAGTHSIVKVAMGGHDGATACRARNLADNSCHTPDTAPCTACHMPPPVSGETGSLSDSSNGRMFASNVSCEMCTRVVIALGRNTSVVAGTCVGPNTTLHRTATLAWGTDMVQWLRTIARFTRRIYAADGRPRGKEMTVCATLITAVATLRALETGYSDNHATRAFVARVNNVALASDWPFRCDNATLPLWFSARETRTLLETRGLGGPVAACMQHLDGSPAFSARLVARSGKSVRTALEWRLKALRATLEPLRRDVAILFRDSASSGSGVRPP